jgi:hypothetical protein
MNAQRSRDAIVRLAILPEKVVKYLRFLDKMDLSWKRFNIFYCDPHDSTWFK